MSIRARLILFVYFIHQILSDPWLKFSYVPCLFTDTERKNGKPLTEVGARSPQAASREPRALPDISRQPTAESEQSASDLLLVPRDRKRG